MSKFLNKFEEDSASESEGENSDSSSFVSLSEFASDLSINEDGQECQGFYNHY